MNSPFLRKLFDVDIIPTDAAPVHLVWERPFGAGVWALLLIAVCLLAYWSYVRLQGSRFARYTLATVRGFIIALVFVILSGPMLELPREIIEPDWVVMLVDRSESMTIEDAPGETAHARRSREQQLRRLLQEHGETWAALADQRTVLWLGFDGGTYSLQQTNTDVALTTATPTEANASPITLAEPEGSRTRLARSLEQALQRAAARPISGIVVFSDGRTDDPPERALLRRLQADQIQVFTVPLGSVRPMGDWALRRVDAPQHAFTGDKVPVVVDIDRLGGAEANIEATVRLIDEITGEELDSVVINTNDEQDQVTLTATPNLSGEATWKVVIDTSEPDLIPGNNEKNVLIHLVDRPLNVLFVEGYPRWEYRFLKNLLIREKSIESSVMLISADRDFAQEGNQPITRLPRSPEEFADYDVMIIGDLSGSFFSPDQLEMMRNHVAERGAGLIWIAGERYTPATYAGTALADLLPMRGSFTLEPIGEPVNMQPTPLANRLGVLQLETGGDIGWPAELRDPNYNWSLLQYAQRIEPNQLKPTAVPLAETVETFAGEHLPLVVHMRYGAGQIVYVACDEIWRWRYGRGEDLTEQFWVQLIRMLGRESLSSAGQRIMLSASPRRVETGQPARIDVRLLDAQLVESAESPLLAIIETEDGQRIAEVQLPLVEGAEDHFAATYLLDRPGEYRVRLPFAASAGLVADAPLEVIAPDNELRRPETDHDLLASLATATNGQVLQEDSIKNLPELLPNRSVRTLNPITERIWDTPIMFIVVLFLLTLEWVGRKMLRLV